MSFGDIESAISRNRWLEIVRAVASEVEAALRSIRRPDSLACRVACRFLRTALRSGWAQALCSARCAGCSGVQGNPGSAGYQPPCWQDRSRTHGAAYEDEV